MTLLQFITNSMADPITPDNVQYWQGMLQNATSQYGQKNRPFGPGLLDTYRNAAAGLNKINSVNMPSEMRTKLSAPLKAQKLSAGIGAVTAGLGLASSALSGIQSATQLADTSEQEAAIDELGSVGTGNYDNAASISDEYQRLGNQPDINYDDVRGMTEGQRWKSIGSSALSGFSTGMQLTGNPLAAAAIGVGMGAVQGAATLVGDQMAETKTQTLQNDLERVNNFANDNLQAATSSLQQRQAREGRVNAVAFGGQISRERSKIKAYADSIFSHRNRNSSHSANVKRLYVDGGVVVRIRRK